MDIILDHRARLEQLNQEANDLARRVAELKREYFYQLQGFQTNKEKRSLSISPSPTPYPSLSSALLSWHRAARPR